MGAIKYRPEIDGLRAFAVIPVILFHLGISWMNGGFIGVDVFFVISGFLITKTILADVDQNSFSLINFWRRRILRILPALIVVTFATSFAAYALLYAPQVNLFGKQALAALLSFANVLYYLTGFNYWGHSAESSPLLHTWTLSVEEQFYLFFPLFIVFVLKYMKRFIIQIMVFMVLSSFLMFLYGAAHHPSATFYLLPTRAWELGCGCLLAIATHHRKLFAPDGFFARTIAPVVATLGLVSIVLSEVFISAGVSGYLAIPVLGSVALIACSDNIPSWGTRILKLKPVVLIGKWSYSLYLWHWPAIVLTTTVFPDNKTVLYLVAIPIMFLCSIASYYWVEQPVRKNKKASPILICFAVALLSSTFLYKANILEDVSIYTKTFWYGDYYDIAPNHEWPAFRQTLMKGLEIPEAEHDTASAYTTGGIINAYGGQDPQIVLLGNSHALMWAKVIDEVAEELNTTISIYAAQATPTFFEIPINQQQIGNSRFNRDQKIKYDEMRLHYLRKWKPKVVIISTPWRWDNNADLSGNLLEQLDRAGLKDLLDELKQNEAKVLLMEQPPELCVGDVNAPQYFAYLDLLPEENVQKFIPEMKREGAAAKQDVMTVLEDLYDNCSSIRVIDLFLRDKEVCVLEGANVLYIDDDHLSYQGSLKAKERIRQAIKDALVQQ